MKLNWAERWAVNNPTRPVQQKLEIQWMKRRFPLRPGAAVLEVGCGRGAGAAIIARAFRPRTLMAMDLDLLMIERAKAYLPPMLREEISFYVGDVLTLPCQGQSLDAVFGFGVLHHVPHWQGALKEIARVLKPGGVFFMEELYPSLYQNFITRYILLHPTRNRFRSQDLKKNLEEVGLHLDHFLEHRNIGILGVSTREPLQAPPSR
jgi:ubiquinone/menaquinone biosynthesis C-methylase UbiE